MAGIEENGEAHTLGILRELRELAKEISDGHMDYAHRFHELIQTACNPNLPDVAKDFGFKVFFSTMEQVGARGRTIAVCANITIAIAAWECACMIWDGAVRFRTRMADEAEGIQTWIENP